MQWEGERRSPAAAPPQARVDGALAPLDALAREGATRLGVHGALAVIFVEVPALATVEAVCGAGAFEEVAGALGDRVRAASGLAPGEAVLVGRAAADAFVVLVAGDEEGLGGRAEALAEALAGALGPAAESLLGAFGLAGRVEAGYDLVLDSPLVSGERAVLRAVDRARLMAKDRTGRRGVRSRERLQGLLAGGALRTVLQPLVDLSDGAPRAWEALVRGPTATELHAPTALFALAREADSCAQLDRACCELALRREGELPAGALLFVNALPALLYDRDLWMRLLDAGLDGRRIVVEVNEGAAIHGRAAFERAVEALRARGVRIAIDDLGTGWANLEQILHLEPEFLKLDMGLVRGIEDSPLKQALVAGMVDVAEPLGAVVVAEGVEHPAERHMLRALGVHWGQGWLFGRPEPAFAPAARLGARG